MAFIKRKNGKTILSLSGKEAIAGILFNLPVIIGFFGFFLPMIVESIRISLSNMTVQQGGYSLVSAANNGFEHYLYALTIDPDFNLELLQGIGSMALKVPLILIFSFFAATLINQKFHGRAIARSIFFLPVIMTSGVVMMLESSDLLVQSLTMTGMTTDQVESYAGVARLLVEYTNLPTTVVAYLAAAVNGIYDIVVASGVQILIFLAGLQSISPSLYEASSIEGATAWENFWKITFPMISPIILVNSIYTIVDLFTNETNEMMSMIKETIFTDIKYGRGSAMAWIYFLCIAVILAVAGGLISRKVFYYDEK